MEQINKNVASLNCKGIKNIYEKIKTDEYFLNLNNYFKLIYSLDLEAIRSHLERTIRLRAFSYGNNKYTINEVNEFIQFVLKLAQEGIFKN